VRVVTFKPHRWSPRNGGYEHIIHHTSYIIHHTSYITHHTSHSIHHTSTHICYVNLLRKKQRFKKFCVFDLWTYVITHKDVVLYSLLYFFKFDDVWCVMYDVWCMLYDVWCMMYDVWYISTLLIYFSQINQ